MKKILIVMTLLLAFGVTVALIGCTSNKSNTQNQNATQQPSSGTNTTNKTFTVDELKNYTGQNGTPAYVAVNGTVYDVTNAKKWRNGKHEDGIVAGVDLTQAMGESPHGNKVLNDVPIVGTLK